MRKRGNLFHHFNCSSFWQHFITQRSFSLLMFQFSYSSVCCNRSHNTVLIKRHWSLVSEKHSKTVLRSFFFDFAYRCTLNILCYLSMSLDWNSIYLAKSNCMRSVSNWNADWCQSHYTHYYHWIVMLVLINMFFLFNLMSIASSIFRLNSIPIFLWRGIKKKYLLIVQNC